MTAFMTARAIAALDVVEKLPLKLRRYFLAVNDCIQVGSFESFGEFSGLFVFGAAGEMRSILGIGAREGVRFLVGLILRLVPFFFGLVLFRRFDLWRIKEIGDGRLDTAEIRWV